MQGRGTKPQQTHIFGRPFLQFSLLKRGYREGEMENKLPQTVHIPVIKAQYHYASSFKSWVLINLVGIEIHIPIRYLEDTVTLLSKCDSTLVPRWSKLTHEIILSITSEQSELGKTQSLPREVIGVGSFLTWWWWGGGLQLTHLKV